MKGKRILLGISGGIAAYKIPWLVRLLRKQGAEVICVLTPNAKEFVSELVLSTLSDQTVYSSFRDPITGKWNNHVDLALWADVLVITPLTANTLAKMSSGQCDNLLLAVYLSMREQTIVAPAMDLDMYLHPTTVRNLEKIQQDGCQVIPAATGELASGLSGQGRMEEPERIVELLEQYFLSKEVDKTLLGKTVLITAGPTYEPLDPVRFIGNRSSGKMGFALARACLQRGACVTLVTGPTHQVLNHASLQTLHVSTAQDMFEVIQKYWSKADIGIFASAVSDYRPVSQQLEKIKKHDAALQIDLVKNPDILFWAGSTKSTEQVLVGFALESENVVNNAREKLVKKHLDLIVMNSIRDEGAGFDVDTNRISLLDKNNNLTTFELKSKPDVAVDIVNYLVENLL